MVTQRLVNVERKLRLEAEALAAERAQEAECLKGELTVLQVGFCTIFFRTCQHWLQSPGLYEAPSFV